MQIDRTLILKLENLAKLELSDAERESLTADLNKILAMVGKLEELDTTGVEPLVYISGEQNSMREDKIDHQASQEQALENAPDHDGQYFRVPKVL
ncbi:MAG: Asp-tRNA(Asn)/Glu-tRNA(Gln) amidotransferase subunit GatC [Lewinellaceae bacterium]|nr:Asp-tRNA(Asn)/Glu-tRNA(Gln) amidotransferase subunit GatC [Saprospiraceae bacterium]MCB9340665.1 Asp-tRNA(Asn)/Glu-tRNA(Gln) amidotransferase subunit GatC [Lewinellaceae bacterium]